MAFGDERAGDACRAAASEGNFLAERQLREARYDLVFGNALEFRRGDGGKRELDKIHEVDIADQTQAGEARRAGMEEQSALDEITLEQIFARADAFENFGGKILARQQQAKLLFIQGGIIEESREDLGRGVKKQGAQVVTRSGARELQFAVELGHAISFPRRAPGSGEQGARRIPQARWPWRRIER